MDHKLQFYIKKENSVEIKLALQLPLDIKYFCSMIDVGGRYISLLNYGQNYYEISLLHDVWFYKVAAKYKVTKYVC